MTTLPWIILGDFNDLACHYEKRGSHPHSSFLIQGFSYTLQDCRLMDLGMVGSCFTWDRGRDTDVWVEEWLDRAIATMEWSDLLNDIAVHNILTLSSDHCAIFLSLEPNLVSSMRKKISF